MKTLYLVRHAKASWEEPGVSDSHRPLLPKGIKRTERVAEFLKERGITIDLMLSSPAVRAYETARIMAAGLDYPLKNIKIERKIYEGYHDRILDIIYGTPDRINSLMIFGHNPTISQVANLFIHPGIEIMPTSCVACISFHSDTWAEIPSAEALKEFVIYPKLLK
ncbi:MAG: histidine phosphatase family protein [Bacteroidales bacterium]|jgi:phosphohistidine phosphatase|nr:histidine phosphatase family protein [Bacteroidales bacterium]